MSHFFHPLYQRFKSAVPPIIKKIQIILGLAAGSFTAAGSIGWPGKIAWVGTACAYTASVCASIVLALQFTEQTINVLETTPEVKATNTTNS